MRKNKVILFVLALVLIAGIIMVCIKGFNVSQDLRAHDTLKFVFDQKFKMNDVTKICDEVFGDKEYKVKTVEVFSDAVYIISPTISGEEEQALLEKLDSLYPSENEVTTTDDGSETGEEANEETIFDKLEEGSKYALYHDSKVRIRDVVKPYIIPSIICALVIVVYIAIKYRKLGNWFVIICKTLGEMLVVLLEVLAIIALTRIPFTSTVVPIVMLIVTVCLCIRLAIYEKKLRELE